MFRKDLECKLSAILVIHSINAHSQSSNMSIGISTFKTLKIFFKKKLIGCLCLPLLGFPSKARILCLGSLLSIVASGILAPW
jgi:hypothetical protein